MTIPSTAQRQMPTRPAPTPCGVTLLRPRAGWLHKQHSPQSPCALQPVFFLWEWKRVLQAGDRRRVAFCSSEFRCELPGISCQKTGPSATGQTTHADLCDTLCSLISAVEPLVTNHCSLCATSFPPSTPLRP